MRAKDREDGRALAHAHWGAGIHIVTRRPQMSSIAFHLVHLRQALSELRI